MPSLNPGASCCLAALLLACGFGGPGNLQAAGTADAGVRAGTLASEVIRAAGGAGDPRLPQFLTWTNRPDLDSSCTGPAARSNRLKANLSDEAHSTAAAPGNAQSLRNPSAFYYDQVTKTRLCGPVLPASYTPAPPRLISGQVPSWMLLQTGGIPNLISPQYALKSHAATTFWRRLQRNPQPVLTLNRAPAGGVPPQVVAVNLPAGVFGTAGCKNPPKQEPNFSTPTRTVNLEDFYWVKVTDADVVTGTQCGDIAILAGFNLIEKECATPVSASCQGPVPGQSGWLFATYWWDDSDKAHAHVMPPTDAAHEPNRKAGWQSYAYDASYDSGSPLVSPWAENPKSNCIHCHAGATFPNPATADSILTGPLSQPGPGSMGGDFIFAAPIHQKVPYPPPAGKSKNQK